ncbi:MAG: hypothetical protein JNM63_17940, partial [Spirochaetia bacterium]|nr:hypothetical protein [Spirochaetia bacterium]
MDSPILMLLELQAQAVADADYVLAGTLCQNIQREWDRLNASGAEESPFVRHIREKSRANLKSLEANRNVLERRLR